MRFSAIFLFAAGAIAAPAGHVLHEKREIPSPAWIRKHAVEPHARLPMRIGLTQQNLDKGHDLLMDVSDHESANYGKHYSAEEVADIFAPSKATVDSVKAWLESAGIAAHRVSQSWNKQWIQFDALASEVEGLLHAKYHFYEHAEYGTGNIACDEYHVPAHIKEHIDYITPGIKLYAPKPKSSSRDGLQKRTMGITSKIPVLPPLLKSMPLSLAVLKSLSLDAACQVAIVPECISTMYNITQATKANSTNKMGIFEALGDTYAQQDLDSFYTTFAPNIPNGTHPVLRAVDGATAPTTVLAAGPESDLDFQLAYPIIYPQNTVLFQTDDDVYQANYTYEGFFNNFLDAIDGSYCSYSAFGETGNDPVLDPSYPHNVPGGYKGNLQCGKYKPTNVISISYGGQEPDLPAYYQKRQCNEFLKLGMQGVSVIMASGDSGVSGRPVTGDNGCLGPNMTVFNPDFAASCPYLTAVGATYLPPGASVEQDAEVAVSRFPSGGGFSNIYPAPAYQKGALTHYFTTANPPYPYYNTSNTNNPSNAITNNGQKIYNRAGRGYPDFSAVGDNIVIYNAGLPTLIGGTSASTPIFGAILNRINEERLAVGKKTVGFVNPTLYAHPGVFHDIINGTNPGCGTNGFSAAKGWDPVTGLGTPNYKKMLALYLSLP